MLVFSQTKYSKYLKNFDETKPSDIDDLSGIFLKDGAKLLTTPITQLCNLSVSSGTFPDACKIAKLKPLFTKDFFFYHNLNTRFN